MLVPKNNFKNKIVEKTNRYIKEYIYTFSYNIFSGYFL